MMWTQKVRPNVRINWHRWFAWFPVNVAGFNAYPGTFVWLVTVERKREETTCWGGGDRWEYRKIQPLVTK